MHLVLNSSQNPEMNDFPLVSIELKVKDTMA